MKTKSLVSISDITADEMMKLLRDAAYFERHPNQKILDGKVRIEITDSGEGIEREELPYIWDRYYKVDKTHKRAEAGTGLGLSIVKTVFESHGAVYGVDSTVGEGSTFWFELETE